MAIPTEYEEQKSLICWSEYQSGKYPELKMLFAIPNGTYTPSHKARARAKAEGVKAGVPDLMLPVARPIHRNEAAEERKAITRAKAVASGA